MVIEVRFLSKRYRNQKVLDKVSFDMASGERVGLLGANGAGKSTLIKILVGSVKPSDGQARIHGHDVAYREMSVKRLIGYLPEHNPLYPDMYVLEYLEYVAALYGVSRKVLPALFERVGLTSEIHKKIGQLSKGSRQRVGLAQALAHDPQALIFDEPTTGLDPNQTSEIRQLIRTLGREKTVLFSTHLLPEVEAVCDRVLLLDQGRLALDARLEEVLAKHGSMEKAFHALSVQMRH